MINKIKIRLNFTGVIDIKNIKNDSIMKIDSNSTIADLLTLLGIRQEHKKYIISIVNNEKKKHSYILQDNDQLNLFLPIGGG